MHIGSWGSGGAYHPVVRLVGVRTVGLAVIKVGALGAVGAWRLVLVTSYFNRCVDDIYWRMLVYIKGHGVPAYLYSNRPRSDYVQLIHLPTLLPLNLYPMHSTTSCSFSTSKTCPSQQYRRSVPSKPSAVSRGCTQLRFRNCLAR